MLQITSSHTANNLLFADSIDEVGGSKMIEKNSSTKFRMRFFILGAKLAFTKLKLAFNIAQILHYSDPKYRIQIETDVPGHTIGEIFIPLTLDNSDYEHLMAFFSQKMNTGRKLIRNL